MSYEVLTLKKLKQVFNDIATNAYAQPQRELVVFTGFLGKFIFDLNMLGITDEYQLPKYYLYQPKKGHIYAVFNLFKKHGNFKIILTAKEGKANLDLRYGTTSLGIFHKFVDCIKELKRRKLIQ